MSMRLTVSIVVYGLVITGLGFSFAQATPPLTERSKAEVKWGYTPWEIAWYYTIEGDYDQNGEVNIADLTALGQHLGKVAEGGFFPENTIEALIDGDGNGEINLADMTRIGMKFGADCHGGFNVYRGDMLLGNVALGDAVNADEGARNLYTFELSAIGVSELFIRPADSKAELGIVSYLYPASLRPPSPDERMTLSFDQTMGTLSWSYFNAGDYDQDGEVISYIGGNKLSGDARQVERYLYMDVDAPNTILDVCDGNQNGQVELTDLTVIGSNTFHVVAGYIILGTDDPEIWIAIEELVEIGYISFLEAEGNPALERLRFNYTFASPPASRYILVIPYACGQWGELGYVAYDTLDDVLISF